MATIDPSTPRVRPDGTVPRPPWSTHGLALAGTLAAYGALLLGLDRDPLNRLFFVAFLFLPLAAVHAALSTLLVARLFRLRPGWPTWRLLLGAHGAGLAVGLLAVVFALRLT